MKVLQINAVYKNLSTGRICSELHDFLKNNDSECVTVYGNKRGNYDDTLFLGNIIVQKGHALKTRLFGKIGYYSTKQTKRLLSFIEEYKPDIVQLHNLHSNFVNIPALLDYLGKKDIPTAITLHDCFFYTGGCMHYTVNNCFKWQTKCVDCKFNGLSWFFDKTEKMFSDKKRLFNNIPRLAVIGVSEWITNEAKKSPVLGGAKIIKTVYNGIDLGVFKKMNSDFKKNHGIENCKVILGVASGWSDKKGLNVFLELSKRLAENERIVLVGNMPKRVLSKNIIHISATDNVEELVGIYNSADVFLQASKEETFGKVVAEALACGVPIVTNNMTANPELVDEKTGIILNNDDFDVCNIYSAIKEVIKNGKDFYDCRKRAEQMFDIRLTYDKYFKIYKDLINKK